jgi:NADH:ubiquinone oxidoreductase subunit E
MSEEYGVTEEVEIDAIFCLGCCTEAVSVKIDNGSVQGVSPATVRNFFITKVLPKVNMCHKVP